MDARPAPCRMRVGEAYAQPAEPRRPIAVDPPLVGAGRRRGRHVKGRPWRTDGRWRSRRRPARLTPGLRQRDGAPVTTHGPRPADGSPAILEPERPRPEAHWPQPRDRRQFADGAGVRSLTPRGHVAARPGRLPATPHPSTVCRSAAAPGLPAVRASCRASGVTAAERQRPACAQAAASAARCGPP